MTNQETKLKKKTLSAEQLEKMRLGRMEKAKERREQREKDKVAQKQAIEQQKERIELLKITKKKKAEIKRRLAEVKRGETQLEAVEEIIEQYEPNKPAGRASTPLEGEDQENVELEVAPEPVDKPAGRASTPKEGDKVVEKVKELKIKEEAKVSEFVEETNKFEDYYKEAVNKILETLPESSKDLFKKETDNFNPKLDIKENIDNMINNINSKIKKKVNVVQKVKDKLEQIETETAPPVESIPEKSDKIVLKTKKKSLDEKLQLLYSLR
jgi:hypothetical protein